MIDHTGHPGRLACDVHTVKRVEICFLLSLIGHNPAVDMMLPMEFAPARAIPAPTGRIISLDLFRGLAILLMVFSGLLPKTLPNGFDHGYNPHYLPDPAGHWSLRPEVLSGQSLYLGSWSAYTWVDLVFPAFLFAMGVAVPIALSSRASGATLPRIRSIVGRWFTLIAFAVIVNHLTVSHLVSANPDTSRLITIGSFFLAFLFFVRWPLDMPDHARRLVRFVALLMIVIRIVAFSVRDGQPFKWGDADIIILVLAHCYLLASLLWVATEKHRIARLLLAIPIAFLAYAIQFAGTPIHPWFGDWPIRFHQAFVEPLGVVLHVGAWLPGIKELAAQNPWAAALFDLRPLWSFSWLKYLWVVVPGTLAGDWLLAHARRSMPDEPTVSSVRAGPWALAFSLLLCAALFVGLRNYGQPLWGVGGPLRTPWLALVLALPALIAMARSLLPAAFGASAVYRPLFATGAAFILLGLLCACLQTSDGFLGGGVSKGGPGRPGTLSYYFLSTGCCVLVLLGLHHCFDLRARPGIAANLFRANGQNALLAYFLAHATMPALFGLSLFALIGRPFGDKVGSLNDLAAHLLPGPWPGALWALVQTLLIASIVLALTRSRFIWRA